MANGRITSGVGSGPVKTYTSRGGRIWVSGLKVDGATVIVKVAPAGRGAFNPEMAGGTEWTQSVPAGVGRHTLIVDIRRGDEVEKELVQEIEVVAG